MSAFSTEEMVESFKFLPRYNLDLLLLVCRQWNHLVKTFERQLSLHKLRANFHISSTLQKAHAELQRINFHRKFRPIDKRLKKSAVKMSLEYIHPENQASCPEGPHKELFSFLGSHIKNSTVSLNLTGSMPHGLIKDLIEGQLQRNCSIVCLLLFLCQPFSSIMYNHESESVLNPEISLAELLKVSFLSATKSVSLLQPIGETNEIGPFMTLVDHCTIVCSPANRSRQPVPRLSVSWHFNHNFPEQFIEIFKNSPKDDWPEHIVVTAVSKIEKPGREFGSWAISSYEEIPSMPKYRQLLRLPQVQSILEYIWPNVNEICPNLCDRPMEIVHPNMEDGRRLTIEFSMHSNRISDHICSFIFKTTKRSPDFLNYLDIYGMFPFPKF